jgi:excisionase family DNA binding protein
MTEADHLADWGSSGRPAQPVSPARRDLSDVPPLLLTVKEAARVLRVGRTTVFGLIRSGRLSSVQIGSARRISLRSLESFVAGLAPEPAAPHLDRRLDHDGSGQAQRRRDGGRLSSEALVLPFAGEVSTPALW